MARGDFRRFSMTLAGAIRPINPRRGGA